MVLTYGYLPDRNGEDDHTGNYDGVMVLEHHDEWAIEIEGKSIDLIRKDVKDTYQKAGDSVDEVFSKFVAARMNKDATFTIDSDANLADFTEDHYQIRLPEYALSNFFLESQKSKHVDVSARQRYECPPGSETWLGGQMPRMNRSSCDGIDAKNQPIAPKQRISPF